MSVRSYLTPPQIAKTLGVTAEKVIGWIRRGELRASNIATNLGGRPRFIVAPADLAAFLESRRPQPPAPRQQRRRQPAGMVDYLADIS